MRCKIYYDINLFKWKSSFLSFVISMMISSCTTSNDEIIVDGIHIDQICIDADQNEFVIRSQKQLDSLWSQWMSLVCIVPSLSIDNSLNQSSRFTKPIIDFNNQIAIVLNTGLITELVEKSNDYLIVRYTNWSTCDYETNQCLMYIPEDKGEIIIVNKAYLDVEFEYIEPEKVDKNWTD